MALTEARIQELIGQIGLGMSDLYAELEARKKEMWRHAQDNDEDVDRQTYEDLVKFQTKIDRGVTYVGRISNELEKATFVEDRAVQLTMDGPRRIPEPADEA